jgi:hypothetical protein
MRRQRFFFGLLLSVLISNAFAYSPPDGFRGIKWGSPHTSLGPAKLAESDGKGSDYYVRDKEDLTIGDATVKQIAYGFYKDQLNFVLVQFTGSTNEDFLKRALTAKYGAPQRPNEFAEQYQWGVMSTVAIVLNYSKVTDKGSISYVERAITQQQQADKNARAKATNDKL